MDGRKVYKSQFLKNKQNQAMNCKPLLRSLSVNYNPVSTGCIRKAAKTIYYSTLKNLMADLYFIPPILYSPTPYCYQQLTVNCNICPMDTTSKITLWQMG